MLRFYSECMNSPAKIRSIPPTKMRTTPFTTILRPSSTSDNDGDGPFFDLEFTIPDKSELGSESEFSLSGSDTDNQDKRSLKPHPTSKIQVFLLKFKAKPKQVEEEPIISPLKKDAAAEKRSIVNKYLKKIKPFMKRSSSNGKAVRFGGEASAAENEQKLKKRAGGLIRLRKSKSASAAMGVVRSPPAKGCDDSHVLMEDGIQSAIAYCKRSFNSDTELALGRCRSDPGEDRSTD